MGQDMLEETHGMSPFMQNMYRFWHAKRLIITAVSLSIVGLILLATQRKQIIPPDWLGDRIDTPEDWIPMAHDKQGRAVLFEDDILLWTRLSQKHQQTLTNTESLVLLNNQYTKDYNILQHNLTSDLRSQDTTLDSSVKHLRYVGDCRMAYSFQKVLHLVFTDSDFSTLGQAPDLAHRLKCLIHILEAVAHAKDQSAVVLHVFTEHPMDLSAYHQYPSPLLKSALMFSYVYKNIYNLQLTTALHHSADMT